MLDPTNESPGYLLGQLMAVLERAQQLAMDANATIVDRYFTGASAAPRSVFVRLLKSSQHHLRKAEDDPTTAGTAFLLKRLIDSIADRFHPRENGFPARLAIEQQGLFVLGYHQMRRWLWAECRGSGERIGRPNALNFPRLAYKWTKRPPPRKQIQESIMPTQLITHRYDFACGPALTSSTGTPMATPDAGNAPRIDPETGHVALSRTFV